MAIGCTQGVSIHSLDNEGRRTRLLAGHAGPVTALAASRDGKWLVTGSTDQTLRLWTLAGAETVPDLGATFRREANGDQVVATVRKRSFADDMDLREGDVLDICGFGSSQVDPSTFVARVDAITPDIPISIQVRNRRDDQGKGPFQTVTTKRQSPALTLFPSSDPAGEWVLWMPQGYYDTSIEGDGKYLGWHLNQSWLDQPKPTLHYPIKQFQNKLNRKDIIDQLLETADLDATLAALVPPDQPEPPKLVIKEQPPSVAVEVTEQDGKRAQAHVYAKSASDQEIERDRDPNRYAARPDDPLPAGDDRGRSEGHGPPRSHCAQDQRHAVPARRRLADPVGQYRLPGDTDARAETSPGDPDPRRRHVPDRAFPAGPARGPGCAGPGRLLQGPSRRAERWVAVRQRSGSRCTRSPGRRPGPTGSWRCSSCSGSVRGGAAGQRRPGGRGRRVALREPRAAGAPPDSRFRRSAPPAPAIAADALGRAWGRWPTRGAR